MRMTGKYFGVDTLRLIGLSVMTVAVAGAAAGCGGRAAKPAANPTAAAGPQAYFAAAVSGAYPGNSISDSEYLATYNVDDAQDTFAALTYSFGSGDQKGPQLDYSGTSSVFARGLRSFDISYSNSNYGSSVNNGTGILYNPPLTGNWVFELSGQAGGLVNFNGMPFVPIVAANACPAYSTATPFEFVSIPSYIGPNLAGLTGGIQNWSPQSDTAYGIVDVASKANAISFTNIQQFTSAGTKVASYPDLTGNPTAITSISGACSPTFYGNTVSVPTQTEITDPGVGEIIASSAIVGIGPSGLLLENDGQSSNLVSNATYAGYEPFLGSGTGALGLPQPSGQVDTGALMGAQYLGTIYGGGSDAGNWTSVVASFGFPSAPSDCPSGSFQSPIFGGDYPGNDPTQSPQGTSSGYGNCDVVIDLGKQDATNNGLFPNATIYLGSTFAGNTSKSNYRFPATAVAGQLSGKYAVFVIGVDTTGTPNQAWGIYLFQSN